MSPLAWRPAQHRGVWSLLYCPSESWMLHWRLWNNHRNNKADFSTLLASEKLRKGLKIDFASGWDEESPHSLVIKYGIVLDFTWVWQVIQDSIEKRLHAFVLQCCSYQHWWEESLHCGPADCSLEIKHMRKMKCLVFSCVQKDIGGNLHYFKNVDKKNVSFFLSSIKVMTRLALWHCTTVLEEREVRVMKKKQRLLWKQKSTFKSWHALKAGVLERRRDFFHSFFLSLQTFRSAVVGIFSSKNISPRSSSALATHSTSSCLLSAASARKSAGISSRRMFWLQRKEKNQSAHLQCLKMLWNQHTLNEKKIHIYLDQKLFIVKSHDTLTQMVLQNTCFALLLGQWCRACSPRGPWGCSQMLHCGSV